MFAGLLRRLYAHTLEHRYRYFMIGLAESNPLRSVVEAYHPFTYISRLYLVAWEDGLDAITKVDRQLIPAPEIAIL